MEKCHIHFLINKSAQLISLYKSSTMENVLFLPKLKKKKNPQNKSQRQSRVSVLNNNVSISITE